MPPVARRLTRARAGPAAAADVVLLGDLNAAVGSVQSDAIGTVHAEEESLTGAILHEWLLQWQVALPATFLSSDTEGTTWFSPDGSQRRRLDFVGIPKRWMVAVTSARRLAEIDLALVCERIEKFLKMCIL